METVFDHNITEAEIKELEIIDTLMGETERNYKEWICSDNAYADVLRLFLLRGNIEAAKSYLTKIESMEIKSAFMFS